MIRFPEVIEVIGRAILAAESSVQTFVRENA